MPLPSSFSYYGREDGGSIDSDVRRAYEDGSPKLKAIALSRLRILATLPRREWHEGYFKKLSGNCDGLWEIRFLAENVQQRPLGFHITETEFVILLWAREKGGKFVPKAACEIALRRKAELLQDRKLKHDLWLALE
ncbi:hypothetical protein [Bradyrhizobium sp. LMG 9283]|uniref:hypothetical protein n=1 Tax=Bradyrhizobium sp. LMG 9283 TaxID=592064 RepID=UPI00388E2E3A